MRPVDIIRKKRDGEALSRAEIQAFIDGVTARTWPDYQTSALLMAIVLRGMNTNETAYLTHAMAYSGQKLSLRDIAGPKIDKHSTGGVGDKTSLVIAPLAAACGCIVPMMSGRGLGHTGGTLDKLESIPGFRVGLSLAELHTALKTVGCAMLGQTEDIAPADKILYALRDVTGTVECIPLLTSSILSKKIAEGIDALVMDVKCGHGAFMKTLPDARLLAKSIVETGNSNGVRTRALITAMDAPLGRMVGNVLEVREAIDTLRGEGPSDLEELCVMLTANMLTLGGLADAAHAEASVRSALSSGRGLDVLRKMIDHQGGDARVVDDFSLLPTAPKQITVTAERSGYVREVHAEKVGIATMLLGAGRLRVEQGVDHAVGVRLIAKPGEYVKAGGALVEVHYRTEEHLGDAVTLLKVAYRIDDDKPTLSPLILEHVS